MKSYQHFLQRLNPLSGDLTIPAWSQELLRQAQVMAFHRPLAHVADDGILMAATAPFQGKNHSYHLVMTHIAMENPL